MELIKYEKITEMLPTWLYKKLAQGYIDHQFPRHLFIETTQRCNLSCSYCPRPNESSDMAFEMFKEIVREASCFGKRSFSLHLFGEPLLWNKILDGINFIKQCNRGHSIFLTTNGTLLKRFCHGLKECTEIIWTYRPEAKIGEDILRSLGSRFRVRLIRQTTPPEEFKRWKKWKNVEIRDLHNYGGNVNCAPCAVKRYPCYHLWLAPAVAWNGDILACCADPKHQLKLGNIKNCSIAKAWNSTMMDEIRHNMLEGKYQGPCVTCDVWKSKRSIF